jgi:1,6-anhydro-N-acetylmuramate kinase
MALSLYVVDRFLGIGAPDHPRTRRFDPKQVEAAAVAWNRRAETIRRTKELRRKLKSLRPAPFFDPPARKRSGRDIANAVWAIEISGAPSR